MSIPRVLGAGVVVLLVAVGVALADSGPRTAGSNYVPEYAEVVTLRGPGQRCEEGQVVPADAAGLRLLLGTFDGPRPRVDVLVTARGRTLTVGSLRSDPAPPRRHFIVPLRPVERTTAGARVCVRVRASRGARTVLYGTLGLIRLEWVREGRESWFQLLPTIVHRFALGKANPLGPWLLPFTLALFLLAALGALRLAARELGK